MAVKLESLLIFAQIASVAAEALKQGMRGTMTEREADDALNEVQDGVAAARQRFQQAVAAADAREAADDDVA